MDCVGFALVDRDKVGEPIDTSKSNVTLINGINKTISEVEGKVHAALWVKHTEPSRCQTNIIVGVDVLFREWESVGSPSIGGGTGLEFENSSALFGNGDWSISIDVVLEVILPISHALRGTDRVHLGVQATTTTAEGQ